MAPPVLPDSTTVVPTETHGLPGEDDKIVRELDVYLLQGELGQGTQARRAAAAAATFLLQFPLRPPWRPYHTDRVGLENVKLKPKVKKLQCEVPLETNSRNYNGNAEPSRHAVAAAACRSDDPAKISAITLQSARLEQRTAFAAGFVEEDRLMLLPIDEALQLRPSLAHLDKEKDQSAARKKQDGGEEEDQKQPELLQLTVQVKRRETEQQAEARLKSYAHLAEQEKADQWVALDYHGGASDLAQTVWSKLVSADNKPDVGVTLSREQYLDAIVPGSSSLQGQEPASWAGGGTAGKEFGKPAAAGAAAAGRAAGGDGQQQAGAAVPEEVQPAIVACTMVLLKQAQVVNIDAIRGMLARQGGAAVKALAEGASDAALHQAVLASGEITHLRKSYFPTRLGNTALDPLRDVVIELLRDQEQLKRSDIVEAAKARGIGVSDALYSRVVKELCSSRGSIWTLKG
ncbi:hypothetical protein CHLNCDRAFT_141955 [Chlorella variabilis]|uniref:DNA-directed RNA polymerase III subunit RPC5 n=1 Tax=Chlorella variabilis TaxID=554065 RepID=E1Z7E5_CHLVA|nr:hypothetical protein CHLNCDRAFT_141955 [Chlorella variabilis]EFN57906.1 hypothetical protein CHLNCDRAFT_141955 [Chlorella variabilis]|eukprot:XP_005850008.1 hypothetical protein CHLNCDRAFT_141955 [Chlorella variabilis]